MTCTSSWIPAAFCWLELILAQHRFSCSVVGPRRSSSTQRTSAPWPWDAGPQTSAWLLMCWRVGGQGQATGTLKGIRGWWGSSAAPATFCRLSCSIRNKFVGAWGRADLNEIRADTAVAAAPRFMLVWVFVAVLSLADLALFEKGVRTDRRTLCYRVPWCSGRRRRDITAALCVLEDACD